MKGISEFLWSGKPGTLFTAFLYFDLCFAVWVLNAAMAPFIREEFKLTVSQAGWLTAVPVLAGAIMRLPLGMLAQWIGRKATAQLNMAFLVAGLVGARWLSDSYEGMLILGAILGVAGASFGVALSLGSGWYPPKYKGLAMGIAGAGNSGAVLAVLFAPPMAKAMGWQSVYLVWAVPMILVMAALQWFAEEPPDQDQKPTWADYGNLLISRDAWVFNIAYMLTFGGFIGLTSFLPSLFNIAYEIPKESVGQYTAGIVVMASLLRVGGGWLADTIGGLRAMSGIGLAIAAATIVAATGPANPWVMVGILCFCFAALGAGDGALFQLVPLRFKHMTAVAGSLIGEFGALGGALLPLAMGFSHAQTGGFGFGFLSMTGLALVVLALLALVGPQWTRTWVGAGGKALPVAEPEPEKKPLLPTGGMPSAA